MFSHNGKWNKFSVPWNFYGTFLDQYNRYLKHLYGKKNFLKGLQLYSEEIKKVDRLFSDNCFTAI